LIQFEKRKKLTPLSQLIPQIVARLDRMEESLADNPCESEKEAGAPIPFLVGIVCKS
jgi:hypothetical protein